MKADVFLHFAWRGTAGDARADETIQLDNVKLACEAVRVAKAMGCKRFVHAGSLMSYEVVNSFSSENFIPGKNRVYSIGKLTAGTQQYDFIYVSDAVKAIILVAEKGKNLGNYYIGNSKQKPLREFVESMYKVLESSSELQFGAVPMEAILLDYDELDPGRLERELGFVPEVSFEEGILRLSKWLM